MATRRVVWSKVIATVAITVSMTAVPLASSRFLDWAWAACGGSQSHQAVGGYEDNSNRLGNRVSVLINSFPNNQFDSWRSVTIWQSGNFSAEVGWYVDEDFDQFAHPYKTWVNNGIATTDELSFSSVFLTAGQYDEFKVHDQNHDHQWSFAYNGNSMGNQFVNMDWGKPLNEGERGCTSDSLRAHFTTLENIGCTNCGWQPYSSLKKWVDTASDFNFCRVSNTEFWIKSAC